jgi:Domain of unknown function (DUF4349)
MSATDASAFAGHEELVAQLRANQPVATDRLRERVLSAGQARRRSPRRKLVLVVVPVAVALAVGAALIHGFVSSGSPKRVHANQSVVGLSSLRPVVHGSVQKSAPDRLAPGSTTTFNTAAGAAPVKALSGSSRFDAVKIPTNRLVHADASLQVQVTSRSALSKATNRATQIVGSLGGYAQNVRYQSSHNGSGSAFLDLRVPVQKAQTAIARLGALGRLVSQQVSTQDLQQQLTHETNQIGSLRRAIAVYEHALASGTLSPSQRVDIEIKLSNARHAITTQRKARQGTLAAGATANISLVLSTNKNAFVTPTHHKSGRFGRLLGSAAGFLGLEGIIVLYALIVISPILLIGGLGWWLVRERRRREESRLLASA